MKWYLKVLKNYANFKGRATRSEYWYFALFNTLIALAFSFVSGYKNFLFLQLFYSLAVLLPSIAVAVRRMHDVGKSGWYILIPIYNLILACTDGTRGENEYGYDLKQDTPTFDFEKPNV